MLQIKHPEPFKVFPGIFPDIHGVDTAYFFIKGVFDLQGQFRSAEQQLAVNVPDVPMGEPLKSSLKAASDVTLGKPGTDVLLAGHAYARPGDCSGYVDVSLTVGPIAKTVRVFGERHWKNQLFGLKASAPEPFEKRRLCWENAFGGTDVIQSEPQKIESYPWNPVGVGFRVDPKPHQYVDQVLPSQEDPRSSIVSWKSRPAPAGFGPIPANWQPRVNYAGTYDEAWQKGRAPFLPKDFDPRFFHSAPPDQIVPGHLVGGEPIEVRGATPSGKILLEVPHWQHEVSFVFDRQTQKVQAKLETLMIDLDSESMVLTWAAGLPCDRQVLEIQEIQLNPILSL